MKQNKNAVITFVFNNYDWLRDPITIDDGFDYYCLTDDKNLESKVWKCIYIPTLDSDSLTNRQKVNIAKADFLKYIPDGYEWWICMDASLRIVGSLEGLINYFEENSYDIGISIEETTKTFKEAYYHYNDVVYIDKEQSEKKRTLVFYTNKGHVRYLAFDRNGEIYQAMLKKCNNLLSKEEFKKRYPNVKM
jgi:hypothetical protein